MKKRLSFITALLLVLTLVLPASVGTVLAAGEPNAPSDLGATIMSATRVDLVWTDQSADETSFRIERSEDGFATAPSAGFTAAIDQRTFSDVTVVQNHTYSYRVIAINALGNSAPSNTATVRVTNRLQVGPIDPSFIFEDNPNTSFPGYYQDDQGTRVSLLPITGDGATAPTQIFEPVDPANPYSVFLGMGAEAFYYIATADFATRLGPAQARFAIEANFSTPGDEVVFNRTRLKALVPTPGTYTFIHPYGTQAIEVTQDDIDARGGIFFTDDIGLAARNFTLAANGNMTRFLQQTAPPPPAGWIGDGTSVGPVTGSPTGFNKVRLVAPAGVDLDGAGRNFVESDQFTVASRLATAVAPLPGFTKTLAPLNGVATVTVTFTDTSTNAPTAWLWDFGDGDTSTIQNPSHDYAVAGNFRARLTVTNAGGTASTSQMVGVFSRPVASFTRSLPNGIIPAAISFTDTSTGNPVSWLWDFGDGTTSNLQSPGHSYAGPGTFTITLTVTNPAGSASSSQVLGISGTLVPNFTKIVSGIVAPVTANFTDTSTGTITAWLWNFGDGTTSALRNPLAKTYNVAGNFTVTLTVTDAAGSAATSQVVNVQTTPVSSFTMSSATGVPPLTVNFTDTSAGNPANWLWDFGDGTTSALQNPTKLYPIAGTYTVTLTVSNCAGSSSASQSVMVSIVFAGASPLLLQVGPIDPRFFFLGNTNTSFPAYYQDSDGTRVSLLPITGNGATAPTQIFETPDPLNAYSRLLGFGGEAFYFIATVDFATAFGRAHARFAIEANFSVPGDEVVFNRTRLKAVVPVAGTYTFRHPYGTQIIEVTADDIAARGGIFFTDDIGLVTRDFLPAAAGNISNFLEQTIPPPPVGWIGDGTSVGPVTGSPTGFNRVRLEGPAGSNLGGPGIDFVESDQFSVAARVVTPLTPGFTMSAVSGTAPLTVNFTDTTTGGIPTGFLWNFGDGANDIAPNTSHTYTTAGNFTVTLTVTDAIGSASTSQTVSVFSLPVPSFTRTPAAGVAPLTVRFSGTSTGNVTCRFWDFGDGATSILPNPTKIFAAPGTYTITLTVTNPAGSVSTSQETIVLSGPPVPPRAPALLQPANGAALNTLIPTLSWTAVTGALTYDILITDVSRANPPFSANGITSTSFNVPAGALSAGATYFWQVRAVNVFGASGFTTRSFRTPAGPTPPRPLAPRAGSTLTGLATQLTWSAVAGAITYEVQVSTNARFTVLVAQGTGLTDTSFDILAGTLRGSALYFWRVRVTTDLGVSRWSIASNFRTPLGPRVPPILDAPRGIAPSLTPTLLWHEVRPEAASFDLQLSTSPRFNALVLDQTGVSGTSLTVPAPLNPRTVYFWRVRGVNEFGASTWRVGTFRTP